MEKTKIEGVVSTETQRQQFKMKFFLGEGGLDFHFYPKIQKRALIFITWVGYLWQKGNIWYTQTGWGLVAFVNTNCFLPRKMIVESVRSDYVSYVSRVSN